MRKLLLFLTATFIAVISMAQVQRVEPASRNADAAKVRQAQQMPASDSVIADINAMFVTMEQTIETEFGKLIRETRDNKNKLEEQIKQLDQQIENLKKSAKKLELIAVRLQELLPKFTEKLDSVKRSPDGLLFPQKTAAIKATIQKTIDSIKDEQTAIPVKLSNNNKQIDNLFAQKQSCQQQIIQLDQQAMQLEKQKQASLAELQKERQRALEQAQKQKHQGEKQYKQTLQSINSQQTRVVQDSLRFIRQRMVVIRQ